MTEGPAIVTRGLTRRFGDRVAVDALDMEVPRGEVFGFLGPNGAGKTTTIRMLLGLSHASAGEAWILGHHFRRERASICRRVGAIVETPTFHPDLSGLDNLRVLSWTSGLRPPRGELDALLERVGLAGRGGDRVGGYSLGMKQRLGIAAALVHGPELLFLDEPTNGLDPAGTQEMRSLLGALTEEGLTVLLSSHLLHEVEAVCKQVLILHRGKVRLQGVVSDLLSGSGGFYLRVSPTQRAAELIAATGFEVLALEEDGLEVEIDEPDLPALIRRLVTGGVDLYRVEARRRSLETLFMQWTTEAEATP